ncbi:MAG TPA: hypothetical protein VL221_02025 [Bacteroidota bacterium]|nr:hypothetical protein [Bacteroidota bacterium]
MHDAILLALLLVTPTPDAPRNGWPRQIPGAPGSLMMFEPETDTYRDTVLDARAALSVTPSGGGEPVFGAVWLDCTVRTDPRNETVTVTGGHVRTLRFPAEAAVDSAAIGTAIEQAIPALAISFPLARLRTVTAGSSRMEESLSDTPPTILVRDHPAVLVLIDGDPAFVDVEGTNLRRVANTPFFLVQEVSSGTLFLKGGDRWYTATATAGPWQPIEAPPAEAVALASKSESEKQTGDSLAAGAPGTPPEIIVSTVPAELISSDGPLRMAPVSGTGLLYAANTTSRLFLEINTQHYFFLSSGRWYRAKGLSGPWSPVASNALPADFARIPPGSDRDDVLASVAGTLPAKDAVLDAQIPQVAEVDRSKAEPSLQFDGAPQFARIEGTPMEYALNSSTPVIFLRGKFYDCDRGVWFVSNSPQGPWNVCTWVPPVIYTIPPSYPVYYVRYVRVYGFTPSVVYAGYTPGYTGAYVYGGTVVYGTGYWYRPWYRNYYYARPWTWGFAVHYDPWSGWALGYPAPWWHPWGWYAYGGWGVVHAGWWGPVGYRPMYRPIGGPVYGAGYRPVSGPAIAGHGTVQGSVRTTGMVRTASVYDRWGSGVRSAPSGNAMRTAGSAGRGTSVQAQGAQTRGAGKGGNGSAGKGRGGKGRPGPRGGRGGQKRGGDGVREGGRR